MADNSSGADDQLSNLTRRKLLRRTGFASIAALAGCSGGGGGTPTDTQAGDGGDGGDGGNGGDGGDGGDGGPTPTETERQGTSTPDPDPETFTVMIGGTRPNQANMNPYGKNWIGGRAGHIMYDAMVRRYPPPNKGKADAVTTIGPGDNWIPQVLSDFSIPDSPEKGKTVTLTVNTDHTWQDGTPVTGKDLLGQLKLERYDKSSYWNYFDNKSLTRDGDTIEITLNKAVAPKILLNSLFFLKGPHDVQFRYDVFGKHIEAIESATTDKEKRKARQELSNRNITGTKMNKLGLGNGPFPKFLDATTSEIIWKKYDDYQNPVGTDASDIGIERVSGLPVDSPDQKVRAMKNKKIDAISNAAMERPVYKTLPDQYESVPKPGLVGGVFGFNCRRSPFDKQKVRWALSTIWRSNYELLFQNLPYAKSMKDRVSVSAGVGGGKFHKKILKPFMDQLKVFDDGEKQAAQWLREAGLSKQKGKWVKSDGKVFKPQFKAATFHKSRTQTATSILNQFGIQAEPIVQSNSTWFGTTISNRDYDITNWWGGAGVPIAYEHLDFLREVPWLTGYVDGVPSPYDWPKDKKNIKDEKLVVEMPEVGTMKAASDLSSGQLNEFDVHATLNKLSTASNKQEKQGLIRKLSWFWNWSQVHWGPWLNYLPNMFYNTGKPWKWPSKDRQMMRLNTLHYWPLRFGYPEVQGE